jgi:PTH1 family peptidyl-tRNA hydrolase
MLLIAGLGNPGDAYAGHRHNIGFMALDRMADRLGFGPWKKKFQGEIAEGRIALPDGDSVRATLLKPQTFMNLSGHALGEAIRFHKLSSGQVVVFYDELDLAPGRMRMKKGGGAAGHNGIRSIIAQGNPDVRRARLGIGHPGDKSLVHGYVLSDFSKAERLGWVEPLLDACVDALPFLAAGDDDRFQAEVLRLAPAPKADPRKPPADPKTDGGGE